VSTISWQYALNIALRSMQRQLLDETLVTIVLSGDATQHDVEHELRRQLSEAPAVVRSYWEAPCDCGQTHSRAVLN
jgi:hypothetical protein